MQAKSTWNNVAAGPVLDVLEHPSYQVKRSSVVKCRKEMTVRVLQLYCSDRAEMMGRNKEEYDWPKSMLSHLRAAGQYEPCKRLHLQLSRHAATRRNKRRQAGGEQTVKPEQCLQGGVGSGCTSTTLTQRGLKISSGLVREANLSSGASKPCHSGNLHQPLNRRIIFSLFVPSARIVPHISSSRQGNVLRACCLPGWHVCTS